MTTTTNNVEKIDEIVKVLNGGIEFYEDAIKKVDSEHVRSIFSKMILFRRNAVHKLQPLVVKQTGDVEDSSSLLVSIRQMYTDIKAKITDDDHTYVDQLEEVEDKTLEVIRDALDENNTISVKETLMSLLSKAKVLHDEMKSLQELTA